MVQWLRLHWRGHGFNLIWAQRSQMPCGAEKKKESALHLEYSVDKLCPTLWDSMDSNTVFPVRHQLQELAQIHDHQWCHPNISSSVVPFSSRPQSFSASGSFPMSWVFKSGGQSVGASASASVLPMNIQGWFPLGSTGLISLLSKVLSRVFSSIEIWKYCFFSTQLSLQSNFRIHTWLLGKP